MIDGQRLVRLRPVVLTVCGLAAGWSLAVAFSGGFDLRIFGLRVSSRSPDRAMILAALSALGWVLSVALDRRNASAIPAADPARRAERQWQPLERLSLVITCTAVVLGGVLKGAPVAGGADPYGYVSQAHLWAAGTLRVEQPLMGQMSAWLPPEAFAPLGYRPAPSGTAIVPTYSPGLPLVMAVFERVGGRRAVFFAVPLLGGLAVFATYVMGKGLAGGAVGVVAAILLATSPAFLFQLMWPMSDVPVAAWWALALAVLLYEHRVAALGAGLAAGAAILTRPNLLPLGVVPVAWLLQRMARERSVTGSAAQRAALFAVGAIPACVALAWLNTYWYGSPLRSGYGSIGELYAWQNLGPNLARYPRWLLESQTPVVLCALIAPFLLPRQRGPGDPPSGVRATATRWLGFVAMVFACYLFYAPFEEWWYLRFLLPAFPPLLVLTAASVTGIAQRLPLPRVVCGVAAAVVIALLAWHGLDRSRGFGRFREGERKYAAVGQFVARRLPDRAVLLSVQHSGSLRHYSGRETIRFDWIPADRADAALDALRGLGYSPYAVLEAWEEPQFRARFRGTRTAAALDRAALAELDHESVVRIYDLADPPDGTGAPADSEIFR
ncbi:MAG: glycosyltransferase family 39 protein [Gemmatimonadetes bacterium]|nr:glycosyltransferase family 39 protein [Gemmatimonadota bacterium]